MITLPYKATGWQTAPISCTCEYLDALKDGIHQVPKFCGEPTDYAYPTQGGGWMALCRHHGKHHLPHIFDITLVIQSGEKFDLAPLDAADTMMVCGECCGILTLEEMAEGYQVNEKPACEQCWQDACDHQ